MSVVTKRNIPITRSNKQKLSGAISKISVDSKQSESEMPSSSVQGVVSEEEISTEKKVNESFFRPFLDSIFEFDYVDGIAIYNRSGDLVASRNLSDARRFVGVQWKRYFAEHQTFVNNLGKDLFGDGYLVTNSSKDSIFGFNSTNSSGFQVEKTKQFFIVSKFTQKHNKYDAYSVVGRFANDIRYYGI
ncbi:hypothetical protein DLAC_02133 [Tieghemostelium lacteum]|uniref:Profilin n=1 Tax=Tieghemostelium lacteum TaxID=361077 RepID=A0A152A4P0_TIELA|nr:hypothetical protein DLAC_02133 [Tieghemostelium lacteum]|eukprot:KYR01045.1 hypothetical protein DLAC_02133 [Tieghemostelium lacteum]